ncbi:MAG TPA: GAF domain-containing protein, partial [Gaiellaceae bacterium]|nr:GAF domain-containing protein [Gaiellaceae bacterium]
MTDQPAAIAFGDAAERLQRPALRAAAAGLVALAGPGAVTLLAFGRPHEALPALLYVLAVLFATSLGGRGSGLVAATVSIVPFYYFFLVPHHTWALKSEGAVALAVFVLTGVLGGEVLARQRGARTRAEAEASSRTHALDTVLRLQFVADALVSARTPQEVLDAVLVEGVRAAEARGGLIATLSSDGEWLEVIATRGYDSRYIDPFRRFPVSGDYPLSEAVRTGEGIFIGSEEERDRRYPELVGQSQPGHGLVCLPLAGEHGPIGGLVFSFSTDEEFPPERRALKLALARQAALALERVELAAAERILRERLSFLDEATALLTSSLDLEQTLERLAALAVHELADWCAIDLLVEETGEIEGLVVAHPDPERRRWAEEVRTRTRPTQIDDEFDLTARVMRTGEPEFLREVPPELIEEAAKRDPEAAAALAHISIRSVITLPLRSGGRTFGALTLIAEEREFDNADFALGQQLSARAAIAIENARL